MSDDVHAAGEAVRREVLGDTHVDRSNAAVSDFDADFFRFITETAWGRVWTRPQMDRKTKHLITLSMLAALGREEEFAAHVRATENTGVTPEDIGEVLLHVAVYAGVPAANAARRIARQTLTEAGRI